METLKFCRIFILSLQQLNYTLIPFTSFFLFSSNLCNNVKTKSYKVLKKFNLKPLSLKSLKRGSGHSKGDTLFRFFLSYFLPSLEFRYSSWNCTIFNKLKPGSTFVQSVYMKGYASHEIHIAHKTGESVKIYNIFFFNFFNAIKNKKSLNAQQFTAKNK